jgi:glycosyltransferase involved in cell wall biosynthesis
VITIHDLLCKNTFDSEKKQYVKQSTNKTKLDRSVKRASKIIAISHFTYDEVRKEYGTESSKMSVIYSAADERFHKINNQILISKVLSRYGIHFPYILFVGETSERKNLVRLLHAYHLLKNKNRLKERKLLIVGKRTIDTGQILRTVNELGLSSDVLFTGYIPDEDLPFIYNAADLFVFPSLYEGFGLPLLEAMNCQVPVAASNSTCIPEIVGDGALLFSPYDDRDIADKMDMVINEKMEVGELKRKALIQTDKFSWGKTAEGVIEIFNSLNGRH